MTLFRRFINWLTFTKPEPVLRIYDRYGHLAYTSDEDEAWKLLEQRQK